MKLAGKTHHDNAEGNRGAEMRADMTLSSMRWGGLRVSVRSLLRRLTGTALTLWFVCAMSCASAQEIVPTGPASKSFTLGAFEISVLRDGSLAIANDASTFAQNANTAEVAKVLSDAGAPTDKILLDIDVLLVRMPGHLVLLDAGFGSAGHGALRESLSSAGISPDDITDILITHSHPDHVGGLVDVQGRLAFPKAVVRMSAKEWAFMQKPAVIPAADTTSIAAVVKKQVKTFEPGRPLWPGITPVVFAGHTPGHVGYKISSQGLELVDTGDMVHSSIVSLANPAWILAWDFDKQEGVKTRRQGLQRLAESHQLMYAPHFPFPGVGRIERAGEGFRFRPELPANR
jgi:glyoxylase-like metal-dependent hydrolase (beta-lactamase superfamily II)